MYIAFNEFWEHIVHILIRQIYIVNLNKDL